jgi:choline dehydrogenase-like flavoprotein
VNERRRTTLRAIVETFAPADARVERVSALAQTAIENLSPQRRADLERLLDILTPPMRFGFARAAVLRWFADAPVVDLRAGFAALKRLTLFLCYAESEAGSENPTWTRIGYPGPRDDRAFDDPPLPLGLARDGETIAADVVVIGSGAGGGVAASVFARAGKSVVVLEAGGAYSAQQFTQRETALADLYLDGGLTSSKDLGVVVLAGATLGGGTTVNWCTSFRLPEPIASEWEEHCGISDLGAQLTPHYDALEAELGIAGLERHNPNNRVILDGCRALGVPAATMPRNAPQDCGEGCGYCGFGCAYGKKRSTARAYLPDVVANGGAIYANARAERVIFEGPKACGVEVLATSANGPVRFTVRAGIVVCAAGSLRTPGLLARSGVTHPQLGKRLFLHPVAGALAEFAHPIESYRGPMQTAYSDAYNYRDGNYGAKIEVAPTHPGLGALAVPWVEREQHSRTMETTRNVATMIALTRDRDPGTLGLDDEATIRYSVSRFDGENLLAGLVGVFDVAFAAGAERVSTLHNDPIRIERTQWNAAARRVLEGRLRRIGVAANRQPLFSAHQMGTAPIGAQDATSVVDPEGRVRGYERLLVADASLFPQSSGVNPMLTVMAMARRVATLHG